MTNLFFQHSVWWLLLIVIMAAAISGFLYFHKPRFSKGQSWFLSGLRFVVLVLIALFLLQPMLQSESLRDEKPLLIWLSDNSESVMATADSAITKDFFRQEMASYQERLFEKYAMVPYAFDANVERKELDFRGGETNISAAIEEVQGRYFNQNVGAVVLASDGIYNRGANPLYPARSSAYPIYSIGLGDTTQPVDLRIENLVHNKATYQGSKFPLEIGVNAYYLEGKPFEIKVINQAGEAVYSRKVSISDNNFYHKESLFLEPREAGLKSYKVSVSELEGESTYANNSASFTIDVINRKKQIAIVGSGIHPDLGALARALSSDKNYQVQTGLLESFENLETFDLVVLHMPQQEELLAAEGLTAPQLIFTGADTDFKALQYAGLAFTSKGGSESVFNHLNQSFTLFQLKEEERDFLMNLPPVQSPYGDNQSANQDVLLYQKVGQVATNRPLMAFSEQQAKRYGIFMGTGIWRWRMYNYREKQNFNAFDGFWLKTIQYLTTNVKKRRFVVESEAEYNLGEKLNINARLFNPSFELVNDPEVNFVLKNQSGEEFEYAFNRTEVAYQLQLNEFPAGVYSWRATTSLGAENFVQEGSFAVLDLNLENQKTVANHQLLKNMAQASGGKFFGLAEAEQLVESLMQNQRAVTISYADKTIDSLLEHWWIFFVILALLATEWALRKYWGSY